MTESVYDIHGWNSPEAIKHDALAWAYCLKHREQYTGHVTTGGVYYWCDACDQERWQRMEGLDKTT